jgi:HK97 family phage prohead protease
MGETPDLVFGDPENSLMHSAIAVKPDFSGWATKANLRCSDGRTILPGAFAHQDSAQVPLVWQHGHSEPSNVLGHAVLENRDEGVYAYAYFNETEQAQHAKTLVQHKDISALSIFANQLIEKNKQVAHGVIREVSLVLAGANPGALIDNIEIQHSDGESYTMPDEAVIFTGETISHGEPPVEETEEAEVEDDDEPIMQHVYDGMTDEQKEVVHYMVGSAIESKDSQKEETVTHSESHEEEPEAMKRNVFEQNGSTEVVKHKLTKDDQKEIFADAMRGGSLKEAVETYALKHGITDIDVLFPEVRPVDATPQFDVRRIQWVGEVLSSCSKTPFTRIKSLFADITVEEARAKGYIKGNLKKEEFFGVAKRITTPSTVYKKQKLDRDDILDITDFDVVAWLKAEMRLMLDEELARAILIGDGRDIADEDKIKDPAGTSEGAGIRSVLNDHELYVHRAAINLEDAGSNPSELVDAVVSNMQYYKGTGSPDFYTTLPMLTRLLLAKDTLGRRLYPTLAELTSALGVVEINTVQVMEDIPNLLGILVNLNDYTIGTDRGGDVTMFDFFDIDYNQYKYLIETRVSGALTKIRSAIVLTDSGVTP